MTFDEFIKDLHAIGREDVIEELGKLYGKLFDQGILDSLLRDCDESHRVINGLFSWSSSQQGRDYWDKVYLQLLKHSRGGNDDEASNIPI